MITLGCFAKAEDILQNRSATITAEDLISVCEKHSAKRDELNALTSDDASLRKAFAESFSNYWLQAAEEMKEIFTAQPSTEAGKMAMVWVISNTDPGWETHIHAVESILAYHDSEALAGRAINLEGYHPIYETALRRIADSSSNHAARADALFHLSRLLVGRSRYREVMDVNPEAATSRLSSLGLTTVAYLESTEPKRDKEEAIAIYHQLINEFSQVPYRKGTIGGISQKLLIPLEQSHPDIGKPAPEINGRDLAGNEVRLSELRGKVVVLTFWASWCGPCIKQVPEENKLIETFAGEPFELIGICGDESILDGLNAVDKHGIRFRSIWNLSTKGSTITELFGVQHWPSTFILDRSGVIRYRNLSGTDLEDAVQKILNE